MRDLKFISILSGSCIGHFITKFVQIDPRNMTSMNLTDLIKKMFPGRLDVFPPPLFANGTLICGAATKS